MSKVIAPKYFPSRPPLLWTATTWLMLDRFRPDGWVCGVAWTVAALFWLALFVGFYKEEYAAPADINATRD